MSEHSDELIKTIEHYSYSLNDYIGKGFSSVVYRGKNNLTNGIVAIKVIDLHKLTQSTMQELLESEIKILKSIDHPNILKCENVFITINNCYIVTELCKQGDLAALIKKKGRLRGVEALKTMLEITRAYQHLEKLNIIHRDIKPANILLHENSIKIADFGFARYEKTGKKEKYSVGTPLYMSPEALMNNFYSKQNDIWSLGVVFYQILQGRAPWDPKNQKELKEILKEKKDIIFRVAVRDELQTIIRGCLNHNKDERISIRSIFETLEQMMEEMTKEQNFAYRQTLTKRPIKAVSCTDFNKSAPLLPKKLTSKQPNPSAPPLPGKQNYIAKAQVQKQVEPICSKSTADIQAPQISLEDASRKNHFILKAGINFTRFVFKLFSRLQKLLCPEGVKWLIQAEMVSILQFSISWLKEALSSKTSGQKIGILRYQQFCETRCFSKTALVINEYSQRYTSFNNKMRKYLEGKALINSVADLSQIQESASRMKQLMKGLKVSIDENLADHHLGVDYLITLIILTQMLGSQSLEYFASYSEIEEIVETQPCNLGLEELIELQKKKQMIIKAGY